MKEKVLLSLIDLYLNKVYGENEEFEEIDVPDKEPWKTIKVGYDDVPIFIEHFNDDDYGVFLSNISGRCIIINSSIRSKSRAFFQTVMHEIMHAYAYVFNSDDTIMDEEGWVETSASYLSTFITDNKKFFMDMLNDCM